MLSSGRRTPRRLVLTISALVVIVLSILSAAYALGLPPIGVPPNPLNDLGALLITVHSTSLSPGAYRLDVEGLPRTSGPVQVGRFPLRVAAR